MHTLIIHDVTPSQYTTLRSFVTLTQVTPNHFQFSGALSPTVKAFIESNDISYSLQKGWLK
jgi:hypothetical protein